MPVRLECQADTACDLCCRCSLVQTEDVQAWSAGCQELTAELDCERHSDSLGFILVIGRFVSVVVVAAVVAVAAASASLP
jgi:hypothetical protein